MKQETVEEAAKNYANYNEQMHSAIKEAVIFGAKWQQEQDAKEIQLLREEISYLKRNSL